MEAITKQVKISSREYERNYTATPKTGKHQLIVETIPERYASSSRFLIVFQLPTEKLAPDSIQIHIRLTFVTHSVDFRYTFRFVSPHDLTFVIHSNSHSNKSYFQYIFVTHSVSGSQTPYISIYICYIFATHSLHIRYTFATHSVSHSLMFLIHIYIQTHLHLQLHLHLHYIHIYI